MARARSNPVSIQVVGDIRPQIDQEMLDELVAKIEDADRNQTGWLEKMEKLTRMLLGPKEPKDIPWQGAANITVPMTDGIIRRWRPGITALVTDANPVATFNSPNAQSDEASRAAEPFFTWQIHDNIGITKPLTRLVDLIAKRGHAYSREGWRYVTERFSRVVRADELFPGGVELAVQQAAEAAQLQGAPAPEPAEVVIQTLAAQYGMDPGGEQEGPMLAQAAQALLAGAPNVRIIYESIDEDRPDWDALDPMLVVTDQEADVEHAEFFCIIHEMTPDEILRCARDEKFDPEVAARVAQNLMDSGTGATDKNALAVNQRAVIQLHANRRAGIGDSTGGRKTGTKRGAVWEIFAKLDINGDGIAERVVIWFAPGTREVLAAYEYPFPFKPWPVTLFLFEGHAPRPVDSRGIPEMLFELQSLIDEQENARINAAQIILSPVFQQRNGAYDYANTLDWRPGAIIPGSPGDLAPIQHDMRILAALLQEMQITQRQAESFIGTFDATINNLSQNTERRTAAEVNAVTQLAANVFGLDARMFQESMARSFDKLWKLYVEFGPEETFFQVTGKERPQVALKKDIGRNFNIKPAGSPSSTNRALMLSNVERVLPLILQDQSGIFDRSEALRHWLQLLDPKLADKVILSPEEQRDQQDVAQAAQLIRAQQGIA